MIRVLRLLALYTQRTFLEWTAFRSFLFTLVINQAVTPLLGMALWSAALPGDKNITTYFVALLAVQLMTVSNEYYSVTLHIYEGNLNDDLLRPHAFMLGPLGGSTALRVWHLLIGLPMIGIAIAATGVSFNLGNVLMALPALILAAALQFLFVYALALSALWTGQAGSVTDFGATMVFLLGGVAVPIPRFPESIRFFVEALPFRAMMAFPAEVASGSLTRSQLLEGFVWQIFWFSLLVPLTTLIWRRGVRQYTAIGG